MKDDDKIVDFLFEVGILSKTPRSGMPFLGSGAHSVADHTNRVCYIGWVLATLRPDVDASKVLKMCLLHDLAEARTSDLNHVHQKYVKADEKKALHDALGGAPFADEAQALLDEYDQRKSPEAILAKDADDLEMILFAKEQLDVGNARAKDWIAHSTKMLRTPEAKRIAAKLPTVHADRWWRQLFSGTAGKD